MIRACTNIAAQSNRRRFDVDALHAWVAYYFESEEGEAPGGQAFLVEQDPGFVLGAHFHRQHQFQVVVRGGGTIGRHPLEPFSVHYASAESGYGPIVAGDDGLWYFTLRAAPEHGAFYLPKEAHQMRKGLKRAQRVADAPTLSEPDALRSRTAVVAEALIEPDPDGLAVWLLRLPPDSETPAPEGPPGAGRFYLVAQGSLRLAAEDLPPLSVVFVSADEADFPVRAGPDGLEVLALQCPAAALLN